KKEGYKMNQIMIIEEDHKIASYLEDYTLKYNYHVKKVEASDQIMETFHAYKPQLVLLDINLPYYDGFYWCRQIRKKSICPVILFQPKQVKLIKLWQIKKEEDVKL